MIDDAGGIRELDDDVDDDIDDVDDDVDDDDSEDSLLSDGDLDSDNVGDISVEINVEELVARIESSNSNDLARKREVRRRLEEIEERRRESKDLDSTYNFDFDDDF